jgi:hypothetical protein
VDGCVIETGTSRGRVAELRAQVTGLLASLCGDDAGAA